jgi:glycogen synthase
MRYLPAAIQRSTRETVFVLTPYHVKIKQTRELELANAGEVHVSYLGDIYPVELLLLERDVNWVFLRAAKLPANEPPFFGGSRHPYDVGDYRRDVPEVLLRDALFFGVAAARALPALDAGSEWELLVQDWEAATTCLALAGAASNKATSHLTLHNSYDSRASNADLQEFEIDPSDCPGRTILERAIPLVSKPIFTVSEQFAMDLTGEIIQSRIMAPHLGNLLRDNVIGVNNGMFTEPSAPEEVLVQAVNGDHEALAIFKTRRRIAAFEALNAVVDSESTPVWGSPEKLLQDSAPWFVMAGRDDSRQKGYDVLAGAADRFLGGGGTARFLFFPIPGEEGLDGINFIQRLARKYPESVVALPFLFRTGFLSTIQGASFGVMPSLYEPFGMANEFYLNGAMGIGRATGGLLQQVVPYRKAESFTDAVRTRADRWYEEESPPTGFLFREEDGVSSADEDWEAINAAGYNTQRGGPNRLKERLDLPLFRAMVTALQACLVDAARLYSDRPDLYFKMLAQGYFYIRENFTWEKAGERYLDFILGTRSSSDGH